uniref:Transcription and mRNA export factor ENY2 n=1 Tax=Oryzias latipes TaxID=8090 RepID=A0A3P9JWX7_ORYLA
MNKESRLKATINQRLTELGERERRVSAADHDLRSVRSRPQTDSAFVLWCRLKELLRAKLTECGWKDQMKAHCKEVIREKGLEHVTVEDLVVEITPKGRALVPDSVKKELLQRIRAFLAQHAA